MICVLNHYNTIVLMEQNNTITLVNKGTGAGGANTNKNGLPYEGLTDLNTHIEVIKTNQNSTTVRFKNYSIELEKPNGKTGLFKVLSDHLDKNVEKGHGCKQPDECYINIKKKIIYIIEKKFQQTGGSVIEKIQTPEFKIWNYSQMFQNFTIVYVYCLSDYFKENAKAELEYLKEKKIPVFWGNGETYKNDIIHFMINYE